MEDCMARRALAAGFLVALAFLPAGTASAADVGIRFGYYTEVEEPFAGVEILTRVADNVYFNPNFEWVFTEGLDYYTVNGDFHYDFPTHGRPYVWLGAGLALIRVDFENNGGDTDAGLNILGGVGVRAGEVVPYVQAKVIVKDDSEFVIGFGVRF
jgi:hypothetical protein